MERKMPGTNIEKRKYKIIRTYITELHGQQVEVKVYEPKGELETQMEQLERMLEKERSCPIE